MLQHLTTNVSGKARRETLDGKDYLVVPLSMIVPGVLNGSKGSLYYPPDECSRDPQMWNGIPIVKNHPADDNGNPITARSPATIQKFGLGTVYNAGFDSKLGAEGWFDVQKCRSMIPDEFAKIERGEPSELSTGLFTDNEAVENATDPSGRPYTHIARNYRPDHLAVLTGGKRGACSVKDGCGININEEPTDNELSNYQIDWDALRQDYPAQNQLSHRDLRDQLNALVRERYGVNAHVTDIFDKTVVYEVYSEGSPEKYYQIGYTKSADKVALSDQGTQEVVRRTEYKPVANECGTCGPDCECDDCKEKYAVENEDDGETSWYKLVGNANCGIGPGGFQPGNTCGKGGGGGGGGGSEGLKNVGLHGTGGKLVSKTIGNVTKSEAIKAGRELSDKIGDPVSIMAEGGKLITKVWGSKALEKHISAAARDFVSLQAKRYGKGERSRTKEKMDASGVSQKRVEAAKRKLDHLVSQRKTLAENEITKTVDGKNLPASAFAYVPDPEKPSTWKLRIDDAGHVGGAIAAIGKGFRGNKVSIPAADLPGVKKKIRAAWMKHNPDKKETDAPPIIRNKWNELVGNANCNIGSGGFQPGSGKGGGGEGSFADSRKAFEMEMDLAKSGGTLNEGLTPAKAKRILKDGMVNGKPLTEKQRRMFGAIAGMASNKSTNPEERNMYLTEQQRKEIIDNLISNEGVECDGCDIWNEEDREALESLPEEKLVAMNRQRELLANAMMEPEDEGGGDEGLTPGQKKLPPALKAAIKKKMTKNEDEPVTAQQWLDAAPPEIRSVVHNAINFEKKQKEALITRITENERNAFTDEYLQSRSLEELEGLAALATNEVKEKPSVLAPHYAGVGGPVANSAPATVSVDDDLDMIPEPFDWGN